LRTVFLFQSNCTNDHYRSSTELLLWAISKNKGIKKTCLDAILPSAAFCAAMSGCTSLRTLNVGFCNALHGDGNMYSLQEQSAIAQVIGSHGTIGSLQLRVHWHSNLYHTIVLALQGMSSLRELTLLAHQGCNDNFFAAVSTFLSSSSQLHLLEMRTFTLLRSPMVHLLTGLKHSDITTGISSTVLSKLWFVDCTFGENAIELLAGFLETRTTNDKGEPIYNSSLEELRIGALTNRSLDSRLSSRLADALLMQAETIVGDTETLCPSLYPSIGSQILCLSLTNVDDAFLRRLKGAAQRVRLQDLGWIGISVETGKTLADCLPELLSLWSLRVANVMPGATFWILQGLAMNGSIEYVKTKNLDGTSNFGAMQLRRIEAYGQRNKRLRTLLETEPGPLIDDADGAELPDQSSNLDVSIFPSLLACAKPIKRTGVALLLSGVLTLGKCKYRESVRHSE
jgi:hypothetical protein